jgi:hypothetical protein
MVNTLSTVVVNQQEAPQKIPEKPVDEEEKKGKEIDPASLGPDGALQYYSKTGDLEAMRKAYQDGAKVNVPERGPPLVEGVEANHSITGDYPLHMAAGGGHQDALNELLNWEADIESKNRIGSTPLLRAVSHDQVHIVKRLLKDGASIATTNKIGNTALHCAAFVGNLEIAKLLIEAQALAHITQANKYGATPLMIAAKSSSTLCKYLLTLRPGRTVGEMKESKELPEKIGSIATDKRLSVPKTVTTSDTEISSPSEQRTIAAPSIAGGDIEMTSALPNSNEAEVEDNS